VKRRFGILCSCLAVMLLAACRSEPPVQNGDAQLAARCDSLTQAFAASLKGELTAALAEGGPLLAIEVCKTTAPAIAGEYSRRPGWQIRRVSSRWRNPDGRPDDYEAAVLERLAAPGSADVDYAWRRGPADDSTFVYMKAIRTAEVCLTCHGAGDRLGPALAEALAREYPDDRATGYRAGDFRGAFVVEVTSEAARLPERSTASDGEP
jgi:hypothetical protein